jgi:hypothetical protein
MLSYMEAIEKVSEDFKLVVTYDVYIPDNLWRSFKEL